MSMADDSRRRGLGRGLSALLGEPIVALESPQDAPLTAGSPLKGLRSLPVEKLRPGRFQPRRVFDQKAIDDLVESVKEKGILQPILVRPLPEDPQNFEIIAGERRWRAAQVALLHEVPVIIRELSDREALEVALIENLQRQDLSPLEEAEGYRRLMDDFSHTQEELAKTVGKSRSHVANTMRLLALPDRIKQLLDEGSLTAGHARALLTSGDPVGLAEQVVAKGLNVRQTEKLSQQRPEKTKAHKDGGAPAKDADLLSLERDMSNLLGLKVSIVLQGKGGEISVQYSTLEQLDDVLHRLSNGLHGRPTESKALNK
jgi:ParB family chromosome partitioning protein